MFKSLALAASALTVATLAALPAQAGCGHPHGGYSSYQSRPSYDYAAKIRAERRAEARAAAVRRAKVAAAAKAEQQRVAKAETAKKADKVASDTTSEPVKDTATIAKVSETRETKVDVAAAEPTSCSKFVPALGATVTVACGNN